MFWNEHAPPHFHATYGEYKATININTFANLGFWPEFDQNQFD